MVRLGCGNNMQRIAGRVGCGETVGVPDKLVFAGNSRRQDDDKEIVRDHNNVAPNVGVDGLKCVGRKRKGVDREPQCPDATREHADARPGGGNPESFLTEQTQVDVTGGTP